MHLKSKVNKDGQERKEHFQLFGTSQDQFCILGENIYYLWYQIKEVMACKRTSTGSSSEDSDSGSTCWQRGTRPDVYTSVYIKFIPRSNCRKTRGG